MKSQKQKSEKVSQERKLINITLVMSIFTLLLSLYTFYSVVEMGKSESYQYTISEALNERSAENRRAIARILACQDNPDHCGNIDWEKPYHRMGDASEDYRHLDSRH